MFTSQPPHKQPPGFLSSVPPASPSVRGNSPAPSFQSFVRSTSPLPVNTLKPLPPKPPASSFPIRRRSSSIYSRTTSRWAATPEPVINQDTVFNARAPSQSAAHNHFTSHSSATADEDDLELLQPMTYHTHKPPTRPDRGHDSGIHMHSRIKSVASTASSDMVGSVETTSLEEAQGKAWYRGQVPMLPEELRERAAAYRNSSDGSAYPHQSPTSYNKNGFTTTATGPESPVLGYYEPRGRTTQRKSAENAVFTPQYGPPIPGVVPQLQGHTSESQQQANMYRSLLRPEVNPFTRGQSVDSDIDVRSEMKLVPQPLFYDRQQTQQRNFSLSGYSSNNSGMRKELTTAIGTNGHTPGSPNAITRLQNTNDIDLRGPALSPQSPYSTSPDPTTPILGRFASSTARHASPHLHSPGTTTKSTKGTTFSAMKDMFTTSMPVRRLSIHKPAVIKQTVAKESSSAVIDTAKHERLLDININVHVNTDQLKAKLGKIADAIKTTKPARSEAVSEVTGTTQEGSSEKKRLGELKKRLGRTELKKRIRVVHNE